MASKQFICIGRARASRASAAVLVLVAASLGALASAGADDGPSAADKAMAEVLFRDGRALFDQGKYDEACPKLAESHRLEPKPGTILNVAFCHQQQGKTATAWTEFMEAASLAARAKQTAREKAAREQIAILEARLSKIALKVTDPAPDIVVKLDDRVIAPAAWTSSIPLDPGDHRLAVSAPGRAPWTSTVTLDPGPSTKEVVIPPLPLEGAPKAPPVALSSTVSAVPAPSSVPSSAPSSVPSSAPRPPDTPPPGGGLSAGMIAGLAAGGVGVAGLVIGSVFGARTFSKKSAGDAQCEGKYCSLAGLDLHAEAETSATISTLGFGVGIAGLGAGAALVLLSRNPKPTTSGAARLWVAPGAAGGPAITIGGAF